MALGRARWAMAVLAMGLLVSSLAIAADEPMGKKVADEPSDVVKASLAKDAICTKCHDENDNKPILTIYQTKHGVKADPRTPTCQSCHGTSESHVRNPQGVSPRPSPEIVFGATSKTPVDEKNAACLTCHQSGLRTFWTGGEHQSRDLACTNCHVAHAPHDNVLAKATQPDVCFA